MNGAGVVFVERLQMPHVVLATESYLDGKFIPEAVAVCHVQGVVLREVIEIRVVRVQLHFVAADLIERVAVACTP